MYHSSQIIRVKNPSEITLQKVNHVSSGTNLVFTSVAENRSDINWLNFGVLIRVLASDGSLLRKCESVYFNSPFLSGPIDVEVVCPNMPLKMPQYSYEVTLVGERY